MFLRETALYDAYDEADEADHQTVSAYRLPVGGRPVGFTVLERQVIALAAKDSLASLESPGRIERLVALLFGLKARARALADHRLETLRRAVVVTRHRHHMPDVVAADLRGVGFEQGHLRMIEALATQN